MGMLEGKVIIVTGAGRGIGRGVAELAAEEGAKVVVNDAGVAVDGSGSDKAPADEVVEAIRGHGGTAVANYESVASMQGGENIIQTALDNFGRLDCLINVAGVLRDRMIFNMTEEEWDTVIAVHLKGHFACTKPAAALMRKQRYGRIINFSSISGLWGNAGQANYAASKAGLIGFTKAVAKELASRNVLLNAVAPGFIDTEMTRNLPDAAKQALLSQIPLQRLGQPDDVASAVVFLASDLASYITGQVLVVDGGMVM